MVFKRLFEVLIARKFRNGNLFSDVIIDRTIIWPANCAQGNVIDHMSIKAVISKSHHLRSKCVYTLFKCLLAVVEIFQPKPKKWLDVVSIAANLPKRENSSVNPFCLLGFYLIVTGINFKASEGTIGFEEESHKIAGRYIYDSFYWSFF